MPETAPTSPATAPRRSWGRRLLIAVLVLLIALVAGALVFAFAVFWGMSGGWDGIRPEAAPDSRKVTAARTDAQATLPERQRALDDLLTPMTGAPLAHGTADGCVRGMNDWKNHTGYTLKCETAVVGVYPLSPTATRPSASQATAADLDRKLRAQGFTPEYDTSTLDIYDSGYGDGRYTNGDLRLVLSTYQAGEPDPLVSTGYPASNAYEDFAVADIDPAITGSSTATLTVIETRTYFTDD